METTITYAAEQFGIKQGTLSNILNGNRGASPKLARKISEKTKTPLDIWLFKTKKNLALRKKAVRKILQSPKG